jgi:hypothetical protein
MLQQGAGQQTGGLFRAMLLSMLRQLRQVGVRGGVGRFDACICIVLLQRRVVKQHVGDTNQGKVAAWCSFIYSTMLGHLAWKTVYIAVCVLCHAEERAALLQVDVLM